MTVLKISEGRLRITTDGKIGCCCGCNGPTSGDNVFEITKEEYLSYKKGGTWNISATMSLSESASGGYSNSGSGSNSGSIAASGCSHDVSISVDTSGTMYQGSSSPWQWSGPETARLQMSLGQASGKYYAQYNAYFWQMSTTAGSNTGYPPTTSITADGNSLTAYSTWTPGWLSSTSGYSNSSSASMTATFTPNP